MGQIVLTNFPQWNLSLDNFLLKPPTKRATLNLQTCKSLLDHNSRDSQETEIPWMNSIHYYYSLHQELYLSSKDAHCENASDCFCRTSSFKEDRNYLTHYFVLLDETWDARTSPQISSVCYTYIISLHSRCALCHTSLSQIHSAWMKSVGGMIEEGRHIQGQVTRGGWIPAAIFQKLSGRHLSSGYPQWHCVTQGGREREKDGKQGEEKKRGGGNQK